MGMTARGEIYSEGRGMAAREEGYSEGRRRRDGTMRSVWLVH
jgi:hypothetical protein